jgi:hypothetical protein
MFYPPFLLIATVIFGMLQDARPPCKAEDGRTAEQFSGSLARGHAFTKQTAGGWVLQLTPKEQGWFLRVTRNDRAAEDLSRLTPPLHFAPNPRDVQGWHFRNSDNTAPNDGTVNAPQELRQFIFSPRVGLDIQGPPANTAITPEEVATVSAFGRGWLLIESYTLTPPRKGERAAFLSLRFSACLTWPANKLRLFVARSRDKEPG